MHQVERGIVEAAAAVGLGELPEDEGMREPSAPPLEDRVHVPRQERKEPDATAAEQEQQAEPGRRQPSPGAAPGGSRASEATAEEEPTVKREGFYEAFHAYGREHWEKTHPGEPLPEHAAGSLARHAKNTIYVVGEAW